MFRYTNLLGNADFGTLGDNASGSTPATGPAAPVATGGTQKTAAPASSSGDVLNTAVAAGVGGLANNASGLCGCANKDQAAENAEKQQLAQKYPVRDCTGLTGTALSDCQGFNASQQAKQDAEFAAWQQAKDAQTSAVLQPSDKAAFAAVNQLATQFKQAHPEAASMTLAQIYKKYPDDFDKIYAQLQQVYPFLKNIDPATALAMNPGIANMTLDQLIAKSAALAGPAAVAPSSGSAGMGIALLAALAGGAILLFKSRK